MKKGNQLCQQVIRLELYKCQVKRNENEKWWDKIMKEMEMVIDWWSVKNAIYFKWSVWRQGNDG